MSARRSVRRTAIRWLAWCCVARLLSSACDFAGQVGGDDPEQSTGLNALALLEAVEFLVEGRLVALDPVRQDGWEGNDLATVAVTAELWSTPEHYELEEVTAVAVPQPGDEIAVVTEPDVLAVGTTYFFGVAHVAGSVRDGRALFVFDESWLPVAGASPSDTVALLEVASELDGGAPDPDPLIALLDASSDYNLKRATDESAKYDGLLAEVAGQIQGVPDPEPDPLQEWLDIESEVRPLPMTSDEIPPGSAAALDVEWILVEMAVESLGGIKWIGVRVDDVGLLGPFQVQDGALTTMIGFVPDGADAGIVAWPDATPERDAENLLGQIEQLESSSSTGYWLVASVDTLRTQVLTRGDYEKKVEESLGADE